MSPAWPARSKLHMKDRLELAVVQEEAQGISEGGISDSVTPMEMWLGITATV